MKIKYTYNKTDLDECLKMINFQIKHNFDSFEGKYMQGKGLIIANDAVTKLGIPLYRKLMGKRKYDIIQGNSPNAWEKRLKNK